MKHAFYFVLKSPFIHNLFGDVGKQLDKNANG